MKLNIIFDTNAKESIIYDLNEVYIVSSIRNNIDAILISNNYKLENREYREANITETDRLTSQEDLEIIEEINKNKQIISFIDKTLEKSFTLKDFNYFNIKFDNFKEISDYQIFFGKIDGEIILDINSLNEEEINNLNKIKFKAEPLINYKYNIDLVSLSEFNETREIIKIMKNNIDRFSLSEIESQMLLYDLIRERIFKQSDDDALSASRDLSRVLKEEEIVCAGYANIFAAVSNYLGIPTFVKYYIDKKTKTPRHATNVSYVYDSVYDESFALEFDATWNSKKNKDDKDWINNYNYFGQSEIGATTSKSGGFLVGKSFIKDIKSSYMRYLSFKEKNMFILIINNEIRIFIKKLIKVYQYLNYQEKTKELKLFLENIDDYTEIESQFIKKLYEDIINIHKKNIPIDIFIKMLYRVRRIEHSLDPKKYPLSIEIIEKIVSDKYIIDQFVLKLLTKLEIENLDIFKNISEYEPKIRYDIKMMELLYNLRELEKQKQEEMSLTNK
ncbi:MAG: hypothetical protein PHU45_02285 [Bacilli bacterium]|nr:hypothetical protein [Bacilli bacterium]